MLDEPVTRLSGVGPAAAKQLAALGVRSVRDLLEHYPRRYADAGEVVDLAAVEVGQPATLVGEVQDLPGTERFFAGGDRSVRGFGLSELSPLNAEGARVGGRHLLAGSVELIRDLPRNFAVAFFFDIGNAVDEFNDPLQYSVGIGLRFRLPVVTLGVDIAQPLTNPICRSITPDPRCALEPGFDSNGGPRLHLNFSPKL